MIIIIDELYRTSEQSARGVSILLPDLLGEQGGLAIGREPARQRKRGGRYREVLLSLKHPAHGGRDG